MKGVSSSQVLINQTWLMISKYEHIALTDQSFDSLLVWSNPSDCVKVKKEKHDPDAAHWSGKSFKAISKQSPSFCNKKDYSQAQNTQDSRQFFPGLDIPVNSPQDQRSHLWDNVLWTDETKVNIWCVWFAANTSYQP